MLSRCIGKDGIKNLKFSSEMKILFQHFKAGTMNFVLDGKNFSPFPILPLEKFIYFCKKLQPLNISILMIAKILDKYTASNQPHYPFSPNSQIQQTDKPQKQNKSAKKKRKIPHFHIKKRDEMAGD